MINIRTGEELQEPSHSLTRRDALKGGMAAILATGVAPWLAGSANGGVARGMMRGIGARNAAMFGGNKWTPEARSYIVMRGNAYIDTGIYPSPTFGFLHTGRFIAVWGCLVDGGTVRFQSSGGISRVMAWPWNPSVFTNQTVIPQYGDGDVYIDGYLCKYRFYDASGDTTNKPSFSLPFSIYIGARNYRGVVDYFGNQATRRVAEWQNGILVHDYYPRVMNGTAGLFDIVGDGGFLTNKNSVGTITYGVGDLPTL